jgi:hypothetical protein
MTIEQIQEALDKGLTVFYGDFKSLVINEGEGLEILFTESQTKVPFKRLEKVILYDKSRNLLYNWFLNRFGYPEYQESYFNTWKGRYKKGIVSFLSEMDSHSFEFFMRIAPIQKEYGF